MNCNSYKAGVSAEVPLAVMTQGGIALLISVHADEVLLLPGAHGGALWLHTQPIWPHLLTPPLNLALNSSFVPAFL